jgi:integrase
MAKGLLEVAADKAKTARRRLIPIRENLAAWLASCARPAGPVCPANWRVRFDKARELAGLARGAWPDNDLRHSFASYHAAHFQDAGKLAADMGHHAQHRLPA